MLWKSSISLSLLCLCLFLLSCGGGGDEAGGALPVNPGYTPSCTGASPVWTATPDYASVSSCVNQASPGDTINVTAGRATWSQTLEMGNKIASLIGNGIDNTLISTNSGNGTLIGMGTGGSRISAMTLINGSIHANGQGFIIDHVKIERQSTTGNGIRIANFTPGVHPTGVIHSCQMINNGIVSQPSYTSLSDQHRYWAQEQTMGGIENVVYIEGNTFTKTVQGALNAVDGNLCARSVIRYNTITSNSTDGNGAFYIEAHSIQGEHRAYQRWEVYNNVINNQGNWHYYPFRLRAGTGVVFNNTLQGNWTNFGIALDNVRSYDDYSGTHKGTNAMSYLSDTTANFASMYFTGALVKNITAGSECVSTSGTATTMVCTLNGGTRQVWNNDDAYTIKRPALAIIRPCDGQSLWDGNEDENGYPCRD